MVSLIEPLGNAMPNKYADELIRTARAIAAPGKGILAADESTGTIGKRVSLELHGIARSIVAGVWIVRGSCRKGTCRINHPTQEDMPSMSPIMNRILYLDQ